MVAGIYPGVFHIKQWWSWGRAGPVTTAKHHMSLSHLWGCCKDFSYFQCPKFTWKDNRMSSPASRCLIIRWQWWYTSGGTSAAQTRAPRTSSALEHNENGLTSHGPSTASLFTALVSGGKSCREVGGWNIVYLSTGFKKEWVLSGERVGWEPFRGVGRVAHPYHPCCNSISMTISLQGDKVRTLSSQKRGPRCSQIAAVSGG